jgi:hypothetical protein
MAISYQSKDDAVLGLQLKVQELCVKKSDVGVLSLGAGTDVIIDIKESVKEVRAALHCDDSVGISLIAQAGIAISGSQITLTLSAALADADSIIVKYVVAE